jgi:hypothetical protein
VSSQKIRRILAVAALTAGVTWLTANASTADACKDPVAPAIATSCGDHTELRLDEQTAGGSRLITDESGKLARAAGEMARQMGLTGLAVVRSAMGPLADLGGVGATWGMPSLATASPALFPMVPGPAGMQDLATMLQVPMLPELPALPQTPIAAKLPAEMTLGKEPYTNSLTGHGIQSPADVHQPVMEIGGEVIGNLLPNAVDSVESTSMLPGGHHVIEGFGGLLRNLDLH